MEQEYSKTGIKIVKGPKHRYEFHSFDENEYVIDICKYCGVFRKKIPLVGYGLRSFHNPYIPEFSKDYINWKEGNIPCVSKL